MCAEKNKEDVFQSICDFPIPTYDEWRKAVEKSLKGAPFSKLLTKTYENITLQPMYQQKDIENLAFTNTVPGQFPFLRGTDDMVGETDWLVAQEMIHPIPSRVNEWLKNDLLKGVNAINLKLDEETKLGINMSENNEYGVSIFSLDDLETILKDTNFHNIPFIIQTGVSSVGMIAFISAYYKKHNYPLVELKGCIGADPLAMLMKNGSLAKDVNSYLDQMAEVLKWSKQNCPQLQTIFIDSAPIHNGGGNAIQELAFSLATATFYIRELQQRGLSIDEIAPSIRFSFSTGSNLFMELAKIRAARMLWSNIIDAFGGNEDSQKLSIHARTSHWTKTVYDPYVNMLRSTVEAFTAALGGVDSLHVSPFDEAFALPNEFSRRIARNIHFIIKEEAQLNKTSDPAGGSWYVEHITAEISRSSWELFQKVEEEGGMYEAIIKGIPQALVNEVSTKKKQDIEKRKLVFVGATMYPNSSEKQPSSDLESLKELKKQRFQSLSVRNKANVSINQGDIVTSVIEAVSLGATIEEVSSALSSGSGVSAVKIETYRATEAFELLRKYSENKKAVGDPINVFLTSIGALSEHKPRTDFIASFFETGGFDVLKNNGYETVEDAISATVEAKANVAVICGKNERYNDFAEQIVSEVKRQRPDMKLFIAGKQDSDLEERLNSTGVDGYIHVGSNCYQLLLQLQGEKEAMINE